MAWPGWDICVEFLDQERLPVAILSSAPILHTDGDTEAQSRLLTQHVLPLPSAAQLREDVEEGGGGTPGELSPQP